MNKEEKEILMDQFFLGQLNDVERKKFETMLVTDESFYQEFKTHHKFFVSVHLEEDEKLKQKLSVWEEPKPPKPKKNRFKSLAWKIATGLILLVGSVLFFLVMAG